MSHTKVDKNKYRIFISDGFNLDGSRRRFSKTIETDLKGRDLEKFLTIKKYEFEDEIKKKDPKFHRLARGSFGEYSIWWLEYKENHEGLAPKTLEEYRKLLDTRILPYIENKVLDKITTADMLELMELIKNSPAKTETGKLSIKSIKHYHTLLKNMFNDAIRFKIISENPIKNVPIENPRAKLKDNYYTIDDVNKMLNHLVKEPIKYQLLILLAITTGARLGEITGLQWKHIDLDNKEIKIEQSNSYTKEKGCFIKSTKNTHSERTVAFPSFLINLIKKHREDESLKKKLLANKWHYGKDSKDEDDFIFTQDDGSLIFVSTPSKWFNRFLKRNDLKHITFHGLRHTNTTILINKNIDIVSISHSLGHAKTSTTTDYYAHHLESVERKMADTFDDIIANSKEEQEKTESGTEGGTRAPHLRVVK